MVAMWAAPGTWLWAVRRYLAVVALGSVACEFAHMPLYTLWRTGTPGEIVFAALHCAGGDVLIATASLVLALRRLGRTYSSAWRCAMSANKKLTMTVAALMVGALFAGPAQAETAKLSEVSHLHGIAVDPTDPARLYLATHHGVWLTNPDGTATRISDNRNDYMGFTPNPAQPIAFFASGHPEKGGNLGVLVSTDGAKTWTQISAGVNGPVDFHSMDVSPADPKVLYGHYGSVQVSRDAGKTWEVTGKPPADMFDLAASSKDPNTVYGATRAGLLVSRDAGRTWQAAYIVQRPATMVVTTKDGAAYAFQVGTGLLRTTEPSLAWQPVSNGFGDAVLLHLAVDPTNPERLYAVTDKSAILASQDGGKTWKPFKP